jgi:hypothetical protein
MSRRSVTKQNILDKIGWDVSVGVVNGLDRELKKVSKDKWKLKEAKRERRRKSR